MQQVCRFFSHVKQPDSLNPPLALPGEIEIYVIAKLDRQELGRFELVSKNAFQFTEVIWESWRKRDYLNFSWTSIPEGELSHHKWSYLLNDAIVTCLDKIGIKKIKEYPQASNEDNAFRLGLLLSTSKLSYNKKFFKYVLNRFPEFELFFNHVLSGKKLSLHKHEQLMMELLNGKECGGDLALKALISEVFEELPNTDKFYPSIVKNYITAIEKNATFLARHWFSKKLNLDWLDENDKFLKSYNSVNSSVCRKAYNESQLIAIKSAEKNDYRPIIKLLSLASSLNITLLVAMELKLPSSVWLDAARQNRRFHQDILLLYAKAFETYLTDASKTVPDYLIEESLEKIVAMKNSETNNKSYDYWYSVYDLFWKTVKLSVELHKIKEFLESKTTI